jgi:protoporphyrin/coproporphyrin ferrochelatase
MVGRNEGKAMAEAGILTRDQIEPQTADAAAGVVAAAVPPDHPRIEPLKTGVVLLNLGTPDATDYWSMRRYLGEFLSDRRVIDYPAWLWQPLLQLVILSKRPTSKGKDYESIWNKELDESPLKTVTRSQSDKLAARLAARSPHLLVDWAMRYGNPSIKSVLDRLVERGCRRLLLMALYPQYAAPTTATAYDKAFDALKQMRWQPAVRTMGPYHDHPRYIEVLARSIRDHLAGLDWQPDLVVFSYHGMPKRLLLSGDPYHCHCQKTTRLVRERLGWPVEKTMVCFQSRFGSEEWLQPYLDKTMEQLPAQGVRSIAVVSPAFATDCLETLEEIQVENREIFLHAGGERFTYIPCLNDGDAHIALIEELALAELGGWL